MYKVIHGFADMLDKGFVYRVGDEFPRLGFSVSESRLKELLTSTNRLGTPLIEQTRSNQPLMAQISDNSEEPKQISTKPKTRRKTAKKAE